MQSSREAKETPHGTHSLMSAYTEMSQLELEPLALKEVLLVYVFFFSTHIPHWMFLLASIQPKLKLHTAFYSIFHATHFDDVLLFAYRHQIAGHRIMNE